MKCFWLILLLLYSSVELKTDVKNISYVQLLIYPQNKKSKLKFTKASGLIKQINKVKQSFYVYLQCTHLCITCLDSGPGKCVKCPKGFYAYKNDCVKYCLEDTYADNATFSCLPYSSMIYII